MLPTWCGALTSWRRWLQACGLLRRSPSPSTPGSSWPWRGASFIFSLSSSVPQSPSLWTTPRQCQVTQTGGHSLLDPQRHCTTNYSLGRASSCRPPFPVHHGEAQRSCRRSVTAQSGPGLRVDSKKGGISGSAQTVAGDGGLVCHLVQSPLYTLFHALPRSLCPESGHASPGMGQASGLRLPSLGTDSSRPQEAPCVLGGPYDVGGSVLASAPMVPRSSGSGSGWSSSSAPMSRSTHLLGIHRLSLHAWQLSSDSPGLRASPLV